MTETAEVWVDPYKELWTPYSEEELDNIKLGLMRIPFDVMTKKRYLFAEHAGGKVFKSHLDLSEWIGSELDIPVWHRCAQIDFNRSTVIGYCPGRVTNGFQIDIESIKLNIPANELVVRVVEREPVTPPPDGQSMYSQPFEIVKIIHAGKAEIHFQVVRK